MRRRREEEETKEQEHHFKTEVYEEGLYLEGREEEDCG